MIQRIMGVIVIPKEIKPNIKEIYGTYLLIFFIIFTPK